MNCLFLFQEKTGGVRASGNQSEFFKDLNMTEGSVMKRRKSIPLVSELVSKKSILFRAI